MIDVFERALDRKRFDSHEIAIMREAYLLATTALGLSDNAKIVQKISDLEQLPAAPILARLAVDWYVSELAAD
jgi:hypothetical protein